MLHILNDFLFVGTTPLQGFLLGHTRDESELGTSPVAQLLETPLKPALMPPIMFASSSSKDKSELPTTSEVKYNNIEPLTKNQMLQALSYLLRNDADFVQKLHEAYVKSLTEMVHQNNTSLL